MCEFVCQVSILISVASDNYQTEKVFLLRDSPLASQADDNSPARGGGGGHSHTSTNPQVQWRRGFGFASDQCRVVESSWWPRFLSPSPPLLSSSCGRPRRVQAAALPLIKGGNFRLRELWRETSQPSQAKIADLDVQSSPAGGPFTPATKFSPHGRFSCVRRNAPRVPGKT